MICSHKRLSAKNGQKPVDMFPEGHRTNRKNVDMFPSPRAEYLYALQSIFINRKHNHRNRLIVPPRAAASGIQDQRPVPIRVLLPGPFPLETTVIIKGMIPTGKQVDTGTGQSGWLLHRRNHKHSIRYIELILLLKNPLIKIYIRTRL